MKKILLLSYLTAALFLGFSLGKNNAIIAKPELEFPVETEKTFVFIVYAYNEALWAERSLRSIFEQDYTNYRMIFIDDGSSDNTFEVAKKFILENSQEERCLMVRNQEKLGELYCLHQVIQSLETQEIVIPILAKDWVAHSEVLTRMNAVFQNPDIWIASSASVAFPSYEILPTGVKGFYAALFKEIPFDEKTPYEQLLQKESGGKTRHIRDVLLVSNRCSTCSP